MAYGLAVDSGRAEYSCVVPPIMKHIDIRYTGKGLDRSEILSNLADKPFTFRGIKTATIEGVLQSLKVYDVQQQAEFWGMKGFRAKKAGRHINWQDDQILWWNETPIDRHGEEYQLLLDELYGQCYAQCQPFRQVLLDARDAELDHTIGNTDPERTILTVDEFLSRLRILQQL